MIGFSDWFTPSASVNLIFSVIETRRSVEVRALADAVDVHDLRVLVKESDSWCRYLKSLILEEERFEGPFDFDSEYMLKLYDDYWVAVNVHGIARVVEDAVREDRVFDGTFVPRGMCVFDGARRLVADERGYFPFSADLRVVFCRILFSPTVKLFELVSDSSGVLPLRDVDALDVLSPLRNGVVALTPSVESTLEQWRAFYEQAVRRQDVWQKRLTAYTVFASGRVHEELKLARKLGRAEYLRQAFEMFFEELDGPYEGHYRTVERLANVRMWEKLGQSELEVCARVDRFAARRDNALAQLEKWKTFARVAEFAIQLKESSRVGDMVAESGSLLFNPPSAEPESFEEFQKNCVPYSSMVFADEARLLPMRAEIWVSIGRTWSGSPVYVTARPVRDAENESLYESLNMYS